MPRTSAPRNPPAPPPSAGPPWTQGSEVQQSDGNQETPQETGLGKQKKSARANWNKHMVVFLIGLLRDHNVPKFRTDNAWSKQAWTSIVGQFNKKFSLSFTPYQVKQKEQDLKKEYRTVKELSQESGFGWDSDRMMVTAPDSVWESMVERRNKDAIFWRDKTYPYFSDMGRLYDGRYAVGKFCRGMDHYAKKTTTPSQVSPEVQFQSPSPSIPGPGATLFTIDVEEDTHSKDDTNWFGLDPFTPISHLMSNEGEDIGLPTNMEPHIPEQSTQTTGQSFRPSSSTPVVVDGKRATKKQKSTPTNTTTNATADFHERFLMLKKEEIDRFTAIEEKKMEDPYSIKKCIVTLEAMTDLQTGDMLKAADIFKDSPSNREVFLSFSSDALRGGWLLRQI